MARRRLGRECSASPRGSTRPGRRAQRLRGPIASLVAATAWLFPAAAAWFLAVRPAAASATRGGRRVSEQTVEGRVVRASATPGPAARDRPHRAVCPGTSLRLGPANAPIVADAYLDPAHEATPELAAALVLQVAARNGDLAVDLHFGSSPPKRRSRRPFRARVRALAVALARAGRFDDLFPLLRRDGPAGLGARLANPAGRAELLEGLDLPPAAFDRALHDRCVGEVLARNGRRVQRGSVVIEVAGVVTSDGTNLRNLRALLGRLRSAEAVAARTPSRVPRPAAKRVPEYAHPWPGEGLLLGGPGLAHHALVAARDEADPILRSALPALLAARRAQPGRLSVQIVATGDHPVARDFAARLCAADRAGLALDYARYLARPRKAREVLVGPEASLLRRLDEDEEACRTAKVHPLEGPPGPWIDGRLVSAPQGAAVLATLLSAPPSPWAPFLSAAAPPLP